MKISGWGCYPQVDSTVLDTEKYIANGLWSKADQFIPTGNFRSYGDAALFTRHLPIINHNRLLSFDEGTGLLTCEAGVLLSDIISVFLPRGWFPLITPGTKLITVGGAIACDIHGKNHHMQGCFSECLESFTLLLPNGVTKYCTRSNDNKNLFYATCGGMGLTGIIHSATFYLKKIKSKWIEQTTIKNRNLQETFNSFETYKNTPYSVAWIDCLSKKEKLGRSLLTVGDFSDSLDLTYKPRKTFGVPSLFPSFLLNSFSVKAFNCVYYRKARGDISSKVVNFDSFFYPLDAITNWNRIYGKKGFIQFQFILPKETGYDGMKEILKQISKSNMGSFLAVLKLYGAENSNWLSFPMSGYSLALDFKIKPGLFDLIKDLTDQIIDLGGRVYLAKDCLMKKEQFERSYKNVEKFRSLRQTLGLNSHLKSLLSERLSL